ncbi:MAG TPA: YndJ family transporter [Planctomycetota bacterium]|nr:YndJ family transporter [Planctomycetota bacterium]
MNGIGLMELLFLMAAWGVYPLGMGFLPGSALLTWARRLHPIAAALATVSFFLPKGLLAAGLVVPWLGLNGLVALGGLLHLKTALRKGIPRLLLLSAMFFPVVGGIHLVASRDGYPLAGFPEPIILLTAIHFHYTVFAAPILAAQAGRSRLALYAGLGIVGGTPLLAAGFLFSPVLKAVGVGILCVAVIALALGQLAVAPSLPGRARALLTVSSLSVIAGMILAAVYEHGFYTGRTWIAIPTMAWSHGILNGVGFSLCGLLGWKSAGAR